MNTHPLHKITASLLLGGVLSIAQTPVMALSISQSPLTLGATGILPNVMLMIDDSGSMGSSSGNVPAPNAALTPANLPANYTYNCSSSNVVSGGSTTNSPAPAAIAMKINTVLLTSGGGATGPGTPVFCDNLTCSTTTRFGSTSKCFDNDKYYNVTYYNGSALSGGPFKGLNLNWYFSTGGFVAGTTLSRSSQTWTRMTIAKAAAINLVDAQTPKPGENPTVRLGLTSFNDPQGGRILIPMTDLKAATCIAPDTSKCNDLAANIKGTGAVTGSGTTIGNNKGIGIKGDSTGSIKPNLYTPLAETLADIGRYFTIGNSTGNLTIHPASPPTAATKTLPIGEVLGTSTSATANTPASLSNNNNGLTNETGLTTLEAPIQYYCQKSSVILITDGLPNKDREISPHLRDYTGDCASPNNLCNATPTSDNAQDFSNDTPPTAAKHPMGIAPNGETIPSTTNCKVSGNTASGANAANTKDYLNNMACKNGTKTGRVYEILGSDYLDDVAVALSDMDLRPPASWPATTADPGGKPTAIKNNLTTYAVGIADPVLQEGVLKDAAIKSGGSFAYASDFGALVDALDKIIESIRKGVGSFSAIVANSSQIGVGAAIFQAKYDTASWTGDFLALPISVTEDINKNNILDSGEDVNGNNKLDKGGLILPEAWNAGKKMPQWDLRKIYTFNAAQKGMVFDTANCGNLSNSQKTDLGITTNCATTDTGVWRLDYVRGDTSHEVADTLSKTYTDPRSTSNNTPANRIFRNRIRFYDDGSLLQDPWLLGDIVNSDAAYVSNESYGYGNSNLTGLTQTERDKYIATGTGTFTDIKNNRLKMAYIGANDGMLHGFDAHIPAQVSPATNPVTYVTDANAGKEVLAYLPNGVFSNLENFSKPDYTHRYFVDGSPRVSDVYWGGNSGGWHTVLIGTTGGGGKSVFALDVTNPGTFGAGKVLWELNDKVDNIPSNINGTSAITKFTNEFINNIGYTLPQPYIGKSHYNNKWVAIVANGYLSSSNRAVLFIIDIETGDIIKTIDTGTGDKDNQNGLSTPFAIDYDATGKADGVIDAIYAGDLLGNMWKFDVSDSDPDNWKVAYGTATTTCSIATSTTPSNCKPLFKTPCTVATTTVPSTCQPITNPPQVGRVGTGQTPGSVMVYFGTGKYFEESDNDVTNTQTQSFYGIWDECPLGGDTTKCANSVPKTSLLQQTIDTQGPVDPSKPASHTNPEVRTTSSNTITYTGNNAKKGWYIDFVNPNTQKNEGERIVSASLLRGGRIIFVTLLPIPTDLASTTPDCAARSVSTSWLTELNALSGSRPAEPVLDITQNSNVGDEDVLHFGSGNTATSMPASGIKLENGSSDGLAVMTNPDDPSNEIKFTGSSDGKTPTGIAEKSTGTSDTGAGRQSWRQL
jgi:type IV pilus assembly protein PilY1